MKKLYLFFIIFLSVFFTNIKVVESNNKVEEINNIKKKIEKINFLKLKKYELLLNESNQRVVLNENNYHNIKIKHPFSINIYLDNNNKIRKLITIAQYTESANNKIEYFDNDGSLLSVIFSKYVDVCLRRFSNVLHTKDAFSPVSSCDSSLYP